MVNCLKSTSDNGFGLVGNISEMLLGRQKGDIENIQGNRLKAITFLI